MNTCGTCKYFGESIGVDWDKDCENPPPSEYHSCLLLDLRRKDQTKPAPLAYAQDASDYHACLCVKSEFGCVEWSELDKPND